MASSDMLQMVGIDMNASMMAALNRFKPVGMSNTRWRNGATSTMPKNPMTTEGRAASSSTMGLTDFG